MDIKTTLPTEKRFKKNTLFTLLGIVVSLFSVWSWSQPSGSEKVSADQIWSDTIKQGDLTIKVEGYGKLKSKVQRLLTTSSNAIVEEILLKPGALVTVDSIILRLSNPDILQQVKEAKRELDNRKTNYLQVELNQQRDILSQKAQREQLQSALEIAAYKVEAAQKLVKQGIVSHLDFKGSVLEHRQLSRRIDIEKERLQHLIQVHHKVLEIEQAKINQQEDQLMVSNQRYEKLTVRSGINGVLQSLPVELGQSLLRGEKVALVGSVDQLYAMLNVSQSQMEQVKLSQLVEIDTRAGKVKGHVSRINPMVHQGTISVEIALTGELPGNARPELTVDGIIFGKTLKNITYLKKTVGSAPGSSTTLFRLSQDKNQAERISISYGRESGKYIQIVSGAKQGESYILSDMSRWQDTLALTITH